MSEAASVVEEVIHETWRVIDRWWTDEPIKREYREVTRGGRTLVEWRDSDEGAWMEYERA